MKIGTRPILRSIAAMLPLILILVMSCSQDDYITGTKSPGNISDRTAYSLDTILPGDFKTFGQGGWGSPPHGGNPGAYLRDNWNLLDTVIIGCDTVGGNTLTFTLRQAVTDFLPQGGAPAPLDTSYLNPTNKMTVLAGQVLALALNIGFDLADSSFGLSENHLEDLCVASGTFEGWTVAEVFEEANRILGGCTSEFTANQINGAVSSINENFEDGQVGTYLEYCSTRAHLKQRN